jgi:hypothetical protein
LDRRYARFSIKWKFKSLKQSKKKSFKLNFKKKKNDVEQNKTLKERNIKWIQKKVKFSKNISLKVSVSKKVS